VLVSRCGIGRGMEREERILGSHLGRLSEGEWWLSPEMKMVVFCEGWSMDCKRTSKGEGASSAHGSSSFCGREVTKLWTSRVIFLPLRILKEPVSALVNRIRSAGIHPGTITLHFSPGTSTVTGYSFTISTVEVTKVPSSVSTISTSSIVYSGNLDVFPTPLN